MLRFLSLSLSLSAPRTRHVLSSTVIIHIYSFLSFFLSWLFNEENFFSRSWNIGCRYSLRNGNTFEIPSIRISKISLPFPANYASTAVAQRVSSRVIFSRFPPTPTYTLPVPRGSCNERQRADRQIREPDIAGSETMTLYRLSKIHSAVPSYLLVLLLDTHLFHPSLPRDPSPSLHGPVICPFDGMEKKRFMLELTLMEGGDPLALRCTLCTLRVHSSCGEEW